MEGKLFLWQYLIWVMLLLGKLHGYKTCTEKERNALFEIKKFVISRSFEFESDSVFPTWTNDTKSDCCRWKEIKCNRTSGRVTEIVFGHLDLKENTILNLSLLHPFEDVRSLNFFSNGFTALFDDAEGYKSLGRLRNLEILDLSGNEFNNSIFPFINSATSLTSLFLGGNNMDGHFPAKELKYLTNLELLDLSENKFNGSILLQELPSLRKLKAMDLSGNEFSGLMELQGICKMENIQELDLSKNKLEGIFPLCLTSLSGLRVLDLSSNQLTGNVPAALRNLESLKYLSLSVNNFEGSFSLGLLANLSELRLFKLGSRSDTLQVEFDNSWKPTFQLGVIELPSCNLVKIPYFLQYQKDLSHIDLSDNKISETFPHWLLANNTKLEVLFLQNNLFARFQLPESAHKLLLLDVSGNEFSQMLPENIGWILPNLRSMKLASNDFQGNLPSSLGKMKKITYLDISHNRFHGKLPRNFVKGCYSLAFLLLSHNKLSGEVFPESVNFTYMMELTMDNNQFTGKIGKGLLTMESLLLVDISNNCLTGVIPSWICELPSLTALLLANNMLEGRIPTSLFSLFGLWLLDLSANMLSGDIPLQANSTVPQVLLLQDNNLSGVISDKLLPDARVLDLRNNRFYGSVPKIINAQNIHTLLLRGNSLTGSIPHQLCGLRNIQLLDLANNKLNGSIPSCLTNTSFVFGTEDTSYAYDYDEDHGGDDGRIPMTGFLFTGFSPQKDFGVKDLEGIFQS